MPSVTIQPTSADSYMSRSSVHSNFGTNTGMVVRDSPTDGTRAIGRFDISSISSSAIISSATLSLYYWKHDATDGVGRIVDINRLTETAWTELGVDWADQVHGSTVWTSAGGTYTATGEASLAVPAAFGWMAWNVKTQIEDSLSLGSYEFIAKYDNESVVPAANTWWYTNDYAVDTTKRPKLDITYTIPAFEQGTSAWLQRLRLLGVR